MSRVWQQDQTGEFGQAETEMGRVVSKVRMRERYPKGKLAGAAGRLARLERAEAGGTLHLDRWVFARLGDENGTLETVWGEKSAFEESARLIRCRSC